MLACYLEDLTLFYGLLQRVAHREGGAFLQQEHKTAQTTTGFIAATYVCIDNKNPDLPVYIVRALDQ